jgi:outer membrane protein TolC
MAKRNNHFQVLVRLTMTVVALTLSVVAQNSMSTLSPAVPETSAIQPGRLDGETSSSHEAPVGRSRRITLEQVKQAPDPIASPLGRLGQLSIEASKQHRLSVQADYFPKFGATALNLHFTDFLGELIRVRRPVAGTILQIPAPIIGQNQTVAAVTFTQPITPLFTVYQAVKIARADERIAIAKASVPVAKSQRDNELEEAYFRLLIAQRQLISAELKLKGSQQRQLYARTSIDWVSVPSQDTAVAEAKMELEKLNVRVKKLTASLNIALGWSPDSELELVMPDPLVEDISLEEVSGKSAAGNAEVIEAQETVVKARAAETISKLAYVPTVAAVSGYLFQNSIPAVLSNFGYGGAIASYTLFDFGKREHDIKEARAKYEMAEVGLQLTKAKVAANVKKSYLELQHSRELSQIAQKIGSSVRTFLNVSSGAEGLELKSARAEVEIQMLEADLAHRQAYAGLKALMGSKEQ